MAVGTGLEAGHGLGLQKRGDWGWNTAGLGGRLEHWQRCVHRRYTELISPLYREGRQSSERVSILNQDHTAISCHLL